MNPYLVKTLKLFFWLSGRLRPAMAVRVAERLFTKVPYSKRRDNEIELLERAKNFAVSMENGHQLAAYRWGDKSHPIILFVHGWTATATCFGCFIDPLVAGGYQVISYDGVGHGNSSGRHTSLPEWADSIHAVNKAIGPVHCIIGHSLGSAALIIASSIALDTKKLVFISPATSVVEIVDIFANTVSLSSKLREDLQLYLWQKYGSIASKYGSDWEDIFRSDFKVPTLIIHDENDREVDIKHARGLARQWPWAQLVETKRLGHRRILLSKQIITLISEFLEESAKKISV